MHPQRRIRSFVLRAGRVTAAQERALVQLWPAYGIVPPSVWDAPIPVVVLAADWNLLWHQYRRLIPSAELTLTDVAGVDAFTAAGFPAKHALLHGCGLDDLAPAAEVIRDIDLLFVGKISPHKAPHDLVKMLAVLRRLYDPAARLHLVGSPLGESYEPALRAFIDELGLADAVNIAGSVSGAALEAYLQSADVFVCASDHEGFSVPLAEAMGHGVPIVAYGVTAVPETVADAGLVLPDKSPAHFAAAVARVLTDPVLRQHLSSSGRARAAAFSLPDSQRRFVSLVQEAIGTS